MDRLIHAATNSEVLSIIQDDIEERWDEEWLLELDKSWDAIHRCLTDGTLSITGGTPPLNRVILGGRQLYNGDDYIICLVTPIEAKEVALALAKVDEAWLRGRYDAIDEEGYWLAKSDGDFGYTWEYFSGLEGFFSKAADAGRFVLFTVDQ